MSKDNTAGLKGLDRFQVETIELLTRIFQNPKALSLGAGLVIGALGIGYGLSYFVKHKQESRRIELSKVDQVFDQEIKSYTKIREEIEKKRDGLKAAANKPATEAKDLEVSDSPEVKGLNDQIEALKPEHKNSSEQYRDFFRKYPKTPEGHLAGLRFAAHSAEQKQLEEAQKVLEEIAVTGSQDQGIIYSQGLLLLVSILEDREQYDKALDYSERYLKIASSELKPRALLGKAQIYYLKKDFPSAQSTLSQLLNDHVNSMEADRARNMMALLPQAG